MLICHLQALLVQSEGFLRQLPLNQSHCCQACSDYHLHNVWKHSHGFTAECQKITSVSVFKKQIRYFSRTFQTYPMGIYQKCHMCWVNLQNTDKNKKGCIYNNSMCKLLYFRVLLLTFQFLDTLKNEHNYSLNNCTEWRFKALSGSLWACILILV